MTREDVAKAYIQSAHEQAARAGVIAFGVGVALLALWSAELQDRRGGLLRALAEAPRQEQLALQKSLIATQSASAVQRLKAGQAGSARSLARAEFIETLDAQANLVGQQLTRIETRTAEATEVTFRLPGLPEIQVQDSSAALFWLVSVVALFLYLAWARWSVLRLYARALRIFVSEIGVAPAILQDVAGPLPFWIAPLPRHDGSHVSATLLRSAAGWDRTGSQHYTSVAVLQLVAGYIVLQVVYVGVVFSQVEVRSSGPAVVLSNTPALPMTVIAGLAFAGIALWWLRPDRVPDAFASERQPFSTRDRGRRGLLLSGLALVVGVLSLAAVSPGAVRRALLQPRFRRWSNRRPLATGFYEVGKDKRIHYARGEGRPKRLKSVPDRHITKVDIDRNQLLRVHRSAVEPWLDEATTRFDVSRYALSKEGMAQSLSAAQAGMPTTLLWFERVAEDARMAENREEIEGVIRAVDALAETTSGRSIAEDIRRDRAQWTSWLERLARPRKA